MAVSAPPKIVRVDPGTSLPEIKKYDTQSGIAATDFVYLNSGALALATNTNGQAAATGILGFMIGSDVPSATDVIPKAGLDSNDNGIQRMGPTGTTTDKVCVQPITTNCEVELDIAASAQYANTKVGSTVGIKGATGSSMAYNATSYEVLARVTEVVKMPTDAANGRIRVRFLDSVLQG